MMGKGAVCRLWVTTLILFFGHPKVALSQEPAHPSHRAQELRVWDVSIPESLGYVTETHRAGNTSPNASAARSADPHAPLIIHIQDAHTNYEAQKNIAKILDHLVQRYRLKLILVEGGSGDLSLAYLREYGPPANRRQVGEKYLKAGIISAEEYLEIISDHPLILWGVEARGLYDQNVDAFLQAEELRASVEPALADARRAADALRSTLSSPDLLALEDQAAAYAERTLSLTEYVKALADLAAQRQVDLKGYPNVGRFAEVLKLETTIQLPRVQQEQQRLIGALSGSTPEAELERLVDEADGLREGRVKPPVFYATLERLAAAARVDLTAYPHLSAYLRYLKLSQRVAPTLLSAEIEQLAGELRRSLADTPEAKQLATLLEELDLIEKLLDLRLTPQEYQRLATRAADKMVSRWERFLTDQLRQQGLPVPAFTGLAALGTTLPSLQTFYEVAQNRDEALITNAIAKLTHSGEPLAVLITGGFHSARITKMLRERGVGTVVLTPKVSSPTNERLYRAVLKYKSGRGSFDEVMAIANSAQASAQTE